MFPPCEGACASQGNPCSSFFLHPLLSISARTKNKTNKIVSWVLLHWHVKLLEELRGLAAWRSIESRVLPDQFQYNSLAFPDEFLPQPYFMCVDYDAKIIVHSFRRRGSLFRRLDVMKHRLLQFTVEFCKLCLQLNYFWVGVGF
ncbi:hypothetical protein EUGRSUZ_L01883 [Eucalyptus grandis]|uniref:Uncharacterized protein n=1 Tax=Eucalyptus grandis TaxID=71139 RepID=A0A058ZTB3_EUCGR|nr:hypothetical protein EUGRSUZ_L01883 [Eucalyptus grandis]